MVGSFRFLPDPPSPLAAEVVRTRLLSRLAARFDQPVTAIVAGAGFGKTTLLAQALRHNLAEPVGIDAWVSCQSEDQDPESFVTACCRAAGIDSVGTVRRSADVLAAIREASPIDLCLVIDDVHELVGSESEGILVDIARRLPANGHLVISGRTLVDVALARLRVSERCIEIGEGELAFTPSEERQLARRLGVDWRRPGLAGWPALTRLALTSRSASAYEFLSEEVVAAMEPPLRSGVLALALLGWADAGTMATFCGQPVDIERLAAEVPLLSLSGDRIIRAHDLWSDSVDRVYSPAEITSVLPQACDSLQRRHDFLRLAAVASRFGERDMIRVAARGLVRHTIASLPVRQARALLAAAADDCGAPELMLLQAAVAHAVAVDDPRIDELVAEATASFAAEGDEEGEIAALALAGQIANSRGAYIEFLRIAQRVAELPTAHGDMTLHVLSRLVAATMAEMQGDLSGALDAMATLPPPEADYP